VRSLCLVGGLLLAIPASAQESGRRWSGSVQANGNLLFGDTEQRTFGGRTTLSRADSVLEFSGALQALYGEASIAGEPRAVIKRLWLGSVNADWHPQARWSPFLLATVETNFEKRIASRYNAGLGVKYTAYRAEQSELSLSVALLDERIRSLGINAASSRLTRWSTRLRVRQPLGERARLSHVTFWRPSATAIDRFLVQSTTELSVGLSTRTALTVSLLDIYDSEAVGRGARSYNDGQLLLGVTATW
jgi:hypothetical protein